MTSIKKVVFLHLVALAMLGCTESDTILQADYVFENVNVVPMNNEIVLPNRNIAIKDGNIVAIFQGRQRNVVSGQRIDGNNYYLMPGLADMHIHMRMEPQAMFDLFLANGVTTVVNMRLADGDVDHVKLRTDVAAGTMRGPRYLISGPMLTPDNLAEVKDVIPMVERHLEQSYDVVKIHEDLDPVVYDHLIKVADSHGLSVTGHGQHALPLSESLRMGSIQHMEEFLYVSREGFGEAATGSINNFLAAYALNLAQLSKFTYRQAMIADVAKSGVYVNPTLVIYHYLHIYLNDVKFKQLQSDDNLQFLPRETREEYLGWDTNEYRRNLPGVFGGIVKAGSSVDAHFEDNMRLLKTLLLEMHQAGVPLLLGTDSFGAVVPGFSVHQELELMVSAGLTPYEALKSGTVNVAQYLDEDGKAGTVEVGKRADFILVEGDPLDDIQMARNVRGVFTRGKWYDRKSLESSRAATQEL